MERKFNVSHRDRLRRRTLYYLTNLILPCILIASMVNLSRFYTKESMTRSDVIESKVKRSDVIRLFLDLLFLRAPGRSCHWVR